MSKNDVNKAAESAQAASQTGALPASTGGQSAAQAAPEDPAVQTAPKRYAVAWNSGLHLRASPGADQGILAVLADGEAVEATGEEDGGWLPVKTAQGDGWVMTRYLRAEG